MTDPEPEHGVRKEGSVTVSVRQPTPHDDREYLHCRARVGDGVDVTTLIIAELSPENIRQLKGSDEDGISTSVSVYWMIDDAVRDFGYDGLDDYIERNN